MVSQNFFRVHPSTMSHISYIGKVYLSDFQILRILKV